MVVLMLGGWFLLVVIVVKVVKMVVNDLDLVIVEGPLC